MQFYLACDADMNIARFIEEINGKDGLSDDLWNQCTTLDLNREEVQEAIAETGGQIFVLNVETEHDAEETLEELNVAIFEGGPLPTGVRVTEMQ